VRLEKSRSQPGVGLGLSLVQAIAEVHSARLTLSDGPGLSQDGPRSWAEDRALLCERAVRRLASLSAHR
jgi:hypothetical protein